MLESLTEFNLITPTGAARPAEPIRCTITAKSIRMSTRQVPELADRGWCRIYWSDSQGVILLEAFDEKVPNAFKVQRTRYETCIMAPKFIADRPVEGKWVVEEIVMGDRRFFMLADDPDEETVVEAPPKPRKRTRAPEAPPAAPVRRGRPPKGAGEPKKKIVLDDAPLEPFRPSEALGRMFSEECDHFGKPCPGIGRCKCKCDPCLDVAVNS